MRLRHALLRFHSVSPHPSGRVDVRITTTVEDKRSLWGSTSRHGSIPFQSRIPHPSKRTVLEPLVHSLIVTNRMNRHFANSMRRSWSRCETNVSNKIVQNQSRASSGLTSIDCWRLFMTTKPLDKHMQSPQTSFKFAHLVALARNYQVGYALTNAYVKTPGYRSTTRCL